MHYLAPFRPKAKSWFKNLQQAINRCNKQSDWPMFASLISNIVAEKTFFSGLLVIDPLMPMMKKIFPF